MAAFTLFVAGCGGHDDGGPPRSQQLSCDDSMKTAFKPDANTSVISVKQFKAGDALAFSLFSARENAKR